MMQVKKFLIVNWRVLQMIMLREFVISFLFGLVCVLVASCIMFAFGTVSNVDAVERVETYKAFDGTIFKTETECMKYEERNVFEQAVLKILESGSQGTLRGTTRRSYSAHTVAVRVQQNFRTLVNAYVQSYGITDVQSELDSIREVERARREETITDLENLDISNVVVLDTSGKIISVGPVVETPTE